MAPTEFARARRLVAEARSVVVLTGAGISTASGIPDFRGPDGVWTRDPEAEGRATIARYQTDGALRRAAWRDRVARRADVRQPNAAHRCLVDFAARGTLSLLVTQNVDGLHRDAGTAPDHLVEIHGSARESVCLRCHWTEPIEATFPRVLGGDEDPRCRRRVDGPVCGGLLKSATVSFGQPLDPAKLLRCEAAVRACDLLLCVGTTLSVLPVAGLVPLARASGATVVVVNGQPTAMDHLADALVDGDISARLPALLAD